MQKIAIVQNIIIWGGRLDFIVHLVLFLNEKNIQPDIVTFKAPQDLSPESVRKMYGVDVRFRLRILKGPWAKIPGEFNIFAFNYLLRRIRKNYDLLINSSNTDIFMPNVPTISYIHFPRKARAQSPHVSIHAFKPEKKTARGIYGLYHLLVKAFYACNRRLNLQTIVVFNSKFTRDHFVNAYPMERSRKASPVIYPAYTIEKQRYIPLKQKKRQMIHIGSFGPSKMQKELISLGANLSGFNLFLVGFSSANPSYFSLCQAEIEKIRADNVFLKPDLSLSDRNRLLRESLIYIHSTPNEPFGLAVLHGVVSGNCLPFVPDTGGQKEIVPYPLLQFSDFDDLKKKLKNILVNENLLETLRKDVCENARRFEYSHFREQWRQLFTEIF